MVTLRKRLEKEIVVMMADFNAIQVGDDNTVYTSAMGRHGGGVINRNGLHLVDFCAKNYLVICRRNAISTQDYSQNDMGIPLLAHSQPNRPHLHRTKVQKIPIGWELMLRQIIILWLGNSGGSAAEQRDTKELYNITKILSGKRMPPKTSERHKCIEIEQFSQHQRIRR